MKSFTQFVKEAVETLASTEAKNRGLVGNGHGDWYDKQGNFIAKTVKGKIKFFGQGDNVGNPPPIVFLDGYGEHYFPHVPCVISSFTHTLPTDVDYVEIPISVTTLEDVVVANDNVNIASVQLTAEEQQYVPSLLRSSSESTNPQGPVTKSQFQTITTKTRVPTNSTISIQLRPVYSRRGLHDRFDLNKLAQGSLLQDRKNGFGGFL